jgi:PAS domain-containing protein
MPGNRRTETRIRRFDGEYRWFLIRVVPQLDAGGNVVRWFGSNTDIEDRKRAEQKLLEDERELRRITDAIPHTIVVLDSKGHALFANQAMLDDTGIWWNICGWWVLRGSNQQLTISGGSTCFAIVASR